MEEKKPSITYLHILFSPGDSPLPPPEKEVSIPPHLAENLTEEVRQYLSRELARVRQETRESILAYLEHILQEESQRNTPKT